MEKLYICKSNVNLNEYLKILKENGYKYLVKGQDKTFSGWGGADGTKHIQLIACRDIMERETIYRDLQNDNSFVYVTWYKIDDKKGIYSAVYNKSFTIRNDWTRCFK